MDDTDFEWLIARITPTDDELDEFIERVGIRVDSGQNVAEARNLTFMEMFE